MSPFGTASDYTTELRSGVVRQEATSGFREAVFSSDYAGGQLGPGTRPLTLSGV